MIIPLPAISKQAHLSYSVCLLCAALPLSVSVLANGDTGPDAAQPWGRLSSGHPTPPILHALTGTRLDTLLQQHIGLCGITYFRVCLIFAYFALWPMREFKTSRKVSLIN